MNIRIVNSLERKLVGTHITMSLVNNKTADLWKSFMLRREGIKNNLSSSLISMQQYPTEYFDHFNPNREFQRWATIEVSDFENIPIDMDSFILAEGLYAVFEYKGSSTDNTIFQYIFGTWLPASDYILDDRPHFEILGDKYKNNHPDSEEEIWIPVIKKSDKT